MESVKVTCNACKALISYENQRQTRSFHTVDNSTVELHTIMKPDATHTHWHFADSSTSWHNEVQGDEKNELAIAVDRFSCAINAYNYLLSLSR